MARRDLEIHLEEKAVEYAEAQGCEHVKLDKAKKDWPDRMFLLPNGRVLMVEFKRPTEKPRKRQTVIRQRLSRVGHPVSVIKHLMQFRELLDVLLLLSPDRR